MNSRESPTKERSSVVPEPVAGAGGGAGLAGAGRRGRSKVS